MKKISILLFTLLFAFSCQPDNKAKLQSLLKEREKLNAEIEKLELEIAKTDTTKKKLDFVAAQIETLAQKPFDHYIEVQGKLDGVDNVAATAQTMGIVKSVTVKEGDAVKKGQVLAYLDDDMVQQSLKQLQAQLEFVTDIYNRQKALWEQKVGTEVQYLSAKNNKESLENQINTLKEQLDMYKVKSPINGTIEEIAVKVGQGASPGIPIFKVINFSTVKVVAEVSESYAATIKKGNDAILFFPDLNIELVKKIEFSSKFINPINRTFQIIVQFTPDNNEYRANMISVVKINDYHSDKAITVPINYIQTENDSKFLYIAEQEGNNIVAKKRAVKVGFEYNGVTEITEGVSVGEKIITSNFQDVYDGIIIKN